MISMCIRSHYSCDILNVSMTNDSFHKNCALQFFQRINPCQSLICCHLNKNLVEHGYDMAMGYSCLGALVQWLKLPAWKV